MHLGHAVRVCQCSSAKIKFLRPIPVQVDGEPCMLGPCTINFAFKNQATMLCRSAQVLANPPTPLNFLKNALSL